jgi:RimJ/RimL family protein N-acetyltransferase
MYIREAELKDAVSILQMQLKLDSETKNMMYEKGERPTVIENTVNMIENIRLSGSLFLIAEDDDNRIAGFLSAERGEFRRIHHSAYIVVGILENYQGVGIAKEFFHKLDSWAIDNHISRLELTVRCDNEKALHLYTKNGFEIEGTKRNSLCVNGVLIDEYYMAKLFNH